MADDFQMKMLSLMEEHGLKQDQRENSFYFNDIPPESWEALSSALQETRDRYNRKTTITRYENNIIVNDGGSR
jgi:hypothetical protein